MLRFHVQRTSTITVQPSNNTTGCKDGGRAGKSSPSLLSKVLLEKKKTNKNKPTKKNPQNQQQTGKVKAGISFQQVPPLRASRPNSHNLRK